eukprot:3711069-Rhodomonas_salina.1
MQSLMYTLPTLASECAGQALHLAEVIPVPMTAEYKSASHEVQIPYWPRGQDPHHPISYRPLRSVPPASLPPKTYRCPADSIGHVLGNYTITQTTRSISSTFNRACQRRQQAMIATQKAGKRRQLAGGCTVPREPPNTYSLPSDANRVWCRRGEGVEP